MDNETTSDAGYCAACVASAHKMCSDTSCSCAKAAHQVFEITDDLQAAFWLQALARHYGEPVMPVSTYCDALGTWARVVSEQSTDAVLRGAAKAFPAIGRAIRKSNLLARLIYGGQKLRTVPCPEHRGRWSGCFKTCPNGCTDDENVTGWLPEPDDFRALQARTMRSVFDPS